MNADVAPTSQPIDPNAKDKEWQMAPGDNWDADRFNMDVQRHSATVVGQTAGDLAMAQAKLSGSRRSRHETPSLSPNQNPSKISRVAEKVANSNDQSSPSQRSPHPAQVSQDMAELPSQPPPTSRKIDYDTWDLKRYQHAVTLESRRRFWTLASEAAKQKITDELLLLSPSANTRKQACAMGWIRKPDGEETV